MSRSTRTPSRPSWEDRSAQGVRVFWSGDLQQGDAIATAQRESVVADTLTFVDWGENALAAGDATWDELTAGHPTKEDGSACSEGSPLSDVVTPAEPMPVERVDLGVR